MSAFTTRMEHDLAADREAPGAAYDDIHTLRMLENFDIAAEILRPEVLSRPQMIQPQVA
jgi:aspartate ammonia-lyase